MRLFGDKFWTHGVPWLKGETKALPIGALGSNILCARHNTMLEKLDALAARFVETAHEIHLQAQVSSDDDSVTGSWHSGEALERWMVKLALGSFYSKDAARSGKSLSDDHSVNIDLAIRGLLDGHFEPNCGLYIRRATVSLPSTEAYGLQPLTRSDGQVFTGCIFHVSGLSLMINFDPANWDNQYWINNDWGFRPSEMIFEIEKRNRIIRWTWPPGTGIYAGHLVSCRPTP
jgi:hypothetical protein